MVLYCFDIPTYAIFFILHTFSTSSKSFPPFSPETYNPATSLLGCNSLFLQFILIPVKYSSTIPHNGDCPSIQRHYLVPFIHFTLLNQFCLPEILIPELIFHFVVLLFCHTPITPSVISIFYLSYLLTTW